MGLDAASRAVFASFGVVLIGLLAGCPPNEPVDTGDSDVPTPDTDVDTDTDAEPQDTGPFVDPFPDPDPDPDPCDSLAIDAPTETGPLLTVFLGVTGGIGPFSWSIETNNSGGAMNAGSGEWFTGPVPATDTVAVYDAGCDVTLTADVEIYPAISAVPDYAVVPPGTMFDVAATDGSGSFTCSEGTLFGTASLSGCTFTAGDFGVNTVVVTDSTTQQTDIASIEVVPDVELFSETHLLVPVGFPTQLEVLGGSGILEIPSAPAGLSVVDNAIVASQPGSWDVTVEDAVVGLSQPLTVVASAGLTLDASLVPRDGENLDWGHVIATDLDGDGQDEVIVATQQRAAQAVEGGALLVFAGDASAPGGVSASPSIVVGPEQPGAHGGQGLAVGDFDGDGETDIALGIEDYDVEGSEDHGQVRVYRGVPGALVDPADPWILNGEGSFDQLGYSVAGCDVDGDGFDDLIAGAPSLDDDRGADTVGATGGVQVWFGGPGGFTAALDNNVVPDPDRIWFANRVGGAPDARLAEAGTALATGDLDGDGLCDIAVSGRFGDAVDEDFSRGGVWLVRDEDLMSEGPAWRVLGSSDTVETQPDFGTDVLLVPAPGSDQDALVVGSRLMDSTGGLDRAGVVLAWRSQTLAGLPSGQVVDPASADWRFEGETSNDYVGTAIEADASGALRIGAPRATPEAGGGEHGVVYAVGIDFAVGTVDASSVLSVDGVEQGGYFGHSLAVASDGRLAVQASRADHPLAVPEGVQDGAVYVFDGTTLSELDLPTDAAGGGVGTAMAWFDVDGGGADIVSGAPGIGLAGTGSNAGRLAIWSSGTGAGALHPALDEQDGDEELGTVVRRIGDLNGDGMDDLVVLAGGRNFSNPDAPYALGACGTGNTVSRAGGAFVWLGSAAGISVEPQFAVFGEDNNDRLESVTDAFDFDGDGQQGFAVGTSRGEAVRVYDGPWTPVPGSIVVRCDPETTLTVGNNDNFGREVAAVPSLDGDSCDELAVTAPEDDLNGGNRGILRIFKGCATGAVWQSWTGEANNQRLGSGGLAVGDLTGDGSVDIAVGSSSFDDGPSDVGAVWVLTESDLGSGGAMVYGNTHGSTDLSGAAGEIGTPPTSRIAGSAEDEVLGATLAIHTISGTPTLLVGRPGAFGEAGSIDGWTVTPAGFGTRWLRVGAEGPYARLGQSIAPTPSGLLVGASRSDLAGVDAGAVYRFEVP